MCLDQIRIEAQGLTQRGDSGVQLAFVDQHTSKTVVGFGIVRPQAHCFAVLSSGTVKVTAPVPRSCQVVMSFGESRFQKRRLAIFLRCALVVGSLEKQIAQHHVAIGTARIQTNCFVKFYDALVPLTFCNQDSAQVSMHLR